MRILNRHAPIALLFTFIFQSFAHADETDIIRNVITNQLEAFKRDDAASAYSFAAPVIQQIFPDEDIFIDMVRKAYPQVYRPKSYKFGQIEPVDNAMAQTVILTDESGKQWQALYTLEQQTDGSWKITGCRILKSDITS